MSLFALADPDSSFLTGSGRQLLCDPLHSLYRDQFSWTLSSYGGGPFVKYQWLSEVIFASVYSLGGPLMQVILVGFLALLVFIFLPFQYAYIQDAYKSRRAYLNLVWLFVGALALNGSFFHIYLRPELFTLVLLSFLFSFDLAKIKRPRLAYTLAFFLFVFSANLHAGFVLGLLYLLLLLVHASFFEREKLKMRAILVLISTLGCLINPYGFSLFAYLPKLFFAKVNQYIVELLPLTTRDLFTSEYLPFFWLIVLTALIVIVSLFLAEPRRRVCHSLPLIVFSSALTASAFLHRRMVVFACLSLLYVVLAALKSESVGKKSEVGTKSGVDKLLLIAGCLFCLVFGANFSAATFKLVLPMATIGFQPPFQALDLIKNERPAGNLLNDPQYGDVMIEKLGTKAQVFIDTRFDAYPYDLIRDFHTMAAGKEGWASLIDKYKIDWVFLNEDYPLVKLIKTRGFTEIYHGQGACILVRDVRADLKGSGG
ncbi:MAG: hypothetical protein K2Y32_23230 [Candidatus Obscuribacterales bacterium]|nr:hypothetical protein [Candidatus Obscuribacterales bacterium]